MRKELALVAIVAVSPAFCQVNKCIEPGGHVIYTDELCPASTNRSGTVGGAVHSQSEDLGVQRQRIQLQREKLQLERERAGLEREQSQAARETALPAGAGTTIPKQTGVDSYACEVAKRNMGVGVNKESKMRSQREYEVACFGDRAADIEAQRAGRPQINIQAAPVARPSTCQQVGYTVMCN